jgi:hypothetical protein
MTSRTQSPKIGTPSPRFARGTCKNGLARGAKVLSPKSGLSKDSKPRSRRRGLSAFFNQHMLNTPFEAGRIRWPEMLQYSCESAGHEVRIFVWHPTEAEIDAVDNATARITVQDHVAVCSIEVELEPGGKSLRAPIAWWLLSAHHGKVPPAGSPVRLTLIDGASGVVRAIGYTTMPAAAEAALIKRLRQQAKSPLGHLEMDNTLKKLAFSA